jgi:hypothetical protein
VFSRENKTKESQSPGQTKGLKNEECHKLLACERQRQKYTYYPVPGEVKVKGKDAKKNIKLL